MDRTRGLSRLLRTVAPYAWFLEDEVAGLDEFVGAGWPVLMALSNKDFVGETVGRDLDGRVPATLAATAWAAAQGVAPPARAALLGRPRRLLLPHELVDVLPPPGPRHAPALPPPPPPAPRRCRRQRLALHPGNACRCFFECFVASIPGLCLLLGD